MFDNGPRAVVVEYVGSRVCDGQWHSLRVEKEALTGRLFLDGRQVASNSSEFRTFLAVNTNHPLFIGGVPGGGAPIIRKWRTRQFSLVPVLVIVSCPVSMPQLTSTINDSCDEGLHGNEARFSLIPRPPVIVLEAISSDSLGTRLHMATRSLAIWSGTRKLVSLLPDQIM